MEKVLTNTSDDVLIFFPCLGDPAQHQGVTCVVLTQVWGEKGGSVLPAGTVPSLEQEGCLMVLLMLLPAQQHRSGKSGSVQGRDVLVPLS